MPYTVFMPVVSMKATNDIAATFNALSDGVFAMSSPMYAPRKGPSRTPGKPRNSPTISPMVVPHVPYFELLLACVWAVVGLAVNYLSLHLFLCPLG